MTQSTPTTLSERLATVQAQIRAAETRCGRIPGAVTLLAVSKTHSAATVREAAAAGQTRFGENYLQEALDKIAALADLALEWHFIGPLQTNKTRRIAECFAWVHTVDRLKVAQRLNEQRPPELPPLNVCIQVNISGEASKHGVSLDELPALAQAIATLPRLRLRGLMAIPAPATDFAAQRLPCARLRVAQEDLIQKGLALDTLSMGMSDDLDAAITEGATLVRIGTAIFGPRHYDSLPNDAPIQ